MDRSRGLFFRQSPLLADVIRFEEELKGFGKYDIDSKEGLYYDPHLKIKKPRQAAGN